MRTCGKLNVPKCAFMSRALNARMNSSVTCIAARSLASSRMPPSSGASGAVPHSYHGVSAAFFLALFLVLAPRAFAGESLYERLGGEPGISALVDDFTSRVARDSRINWLFLSYALRPAKAAAMKRDLVEQLCEAAGGPCDWRGKSMAEQHRELGITGARYNALAESFEAALDRAGVCAEDRLALLAALREK